MENYSLLAVYNVLLSLTFLFASAATLDHPHRISADITKNFVKERFVIRSRNWIPLCIGLLTLSAVFLATGCGSSSTKARLLNATYGQSSLGLSINSKTVASGIAYGTASSYASVSSGSENLQITASGSTLINQTSTINSGNDTVLATTSGATVFTDNKTAPSSGNIQIRMINASSLLGNTDVYIVTPGTDISTVNPTFSSVAYQSASSYQTLTAGSYEVEFTIPGSKQVQIDTGGQSFSSGQIRTVVALDGTNGTTFSFSVLSDLN